MARTIARSISEVVEQLELDGDVIVTVQRLADVMRERGLDGDPRRLAYELQRDGWLGTLRTRHVWEFLPGARGGPYGSGDRFIELRARLAIESDWRGALAMESAASVLGLAQRIPEKEVVALPTGEPFPKAFAGEWRHVRLELPAEGVTMINGLPSWDHEGLIVGIAVRPSGYEDAAGLGQWLSATVDVDVEKITRLLRPMGAPARQRAAYLLRASGNTVGAESVLAAYPPTGTAWLGPRRAGGHYDPSTMVTDTVIHDYLEAGGGA